MEPEQAQSKRWILFFFESEGEFHYGMTPKLNFSETHKPFVCRITSYELIEEDEAKSFCPAYKGLTPFKVIELSDGDEVSFVEVNTNDLVASKHCPTTLPTSSPSFHIWFMNLLHGFDKRHGKMLKEAIGEFKSCPPPISRQANNG